ncbi:hypothetical protein BZA70DRAFT_271631 [Myxozyma melibiosi]|uniref:Mitochondrial import receptor subunit TOM20 n=1 Tax=Myxozyma melibiosi TaxID=54550 RepID=A0ABR1FCH4_9ASCO
MTRSRRGVVAILVGSVLLCPILYCIYFDYKRRHDPAFRKLLRRTGKHHRQREAKLQNLRFRRLIDSRISELELNRRATLPPVENSRFILDNLSIGENCASQGDYENSALAFYTALYVYPSPEELLNSVMADDNVRPVLQQMIKLRPFRPPAQRYHVSPTIL